jgi:hypothetical protein
MSDHRDKDFPAAEVKELATKLLTSKKQGCIDWARKALADLAKQASGLLFPVPQKPHPNPPKPATLT